MRLTVRLSSDLSALVEATVQQELCENYAQVVRVALREYMKSHEIVVPEIVVPKCVG